MSMPNPSEGIMLFLVGMVLVTLIIIAIQSKRDADEFEAYRKEREDRDR